MPDTDTLLAQLRDVERAVALADTQRLLTLRTTELAVETVFRDAWPALRERHALTEMVARRMFHHYRAQQELKRQVSLGVMTSASGVLQQVVGSYLRAFLSTRGDYRVAMDRRYGRKLQPDIAVERGGEPFVALEVKTDLGWQRDYVRSGAWEERQLQCAEAGFRHAFLIILANSNWSGFRPELAPLNVRVLLTTSPNDRTFIWHRDESAGLRAAVPTDNGYVGEVLHPLEPLFEAIHSGVSLGEQPPPLDAPEGTVTFEGRPLALIPGKMVTNVLAVLVHQGFITHAQILSLYPKSKEKPRGWVDWLTRREGKGYNLPVRLGTRNGQEVVRLPWATPHKWAQEAFGATLELCQPELIS